MLEMYEEEVISEINKNKDMNFLGVAVTPWHALGVDAVILQLKKEENKVRGYIIVREHATAGILVGEKNFASISEEIELVVIKNEIRGRSLKEKIDGKKEVFQYYLKSSKKQKQKLYFAVPMKPYYEWIPKFYERSVESILTDEGIGAYLNSDSTWWKVGVKERGWQSGFTLFIRLFMRDRFFLKCLKDRGQIRNFQLLTKAQDGITENDEVIGLYREQIMNEREKNNTFSYKGKILINSGLEKVSGQIKENGDLEVYQVICEECERAGIGVILKPHPRDKQLERYKTLKCILDNRQGMSQEVLLGTALDKPLAVLSFSSTSMISAYLFFRIPAIAITSMVNPKKICNQKLYRNFNRMFASLIKIPSNIEECMNIIKTEDANERY